MKKILLLYTLCILFQNVRGQATLVGMTNIGGKSNLGTIFSVLTGDTAYSKIYNFGSTGTYPFGDLCQAPSGKLFGMTTSGGTYSNGVLFEFDLVTNSYFTRITFDGAYGGSSPQGSLVLASNGKMYGMTSTGGANNFGVLFEFNPATLSFSNKHDFSGTVDGKTPNGSLIQASNGKLYGMTKFGGANNKGVLFEFDPITSVFTKLIDFNGSLNGSIPGGSLTQALNGKIYGMTATGGVNNKGVLFKFDPISSVLSVQHNFAGFVMSDGSNAQGSLMLSSNGKLYGLTQSGGTSDAGILFEFNTVDSTYTKKFDFTGTSTGLNPYGSLAEASNGKFYGMTHQGGTSGLGVLFEYDTIASTYAVRLDFNGSNLGGFPYGSLMQASNGKLYGMTFQGGISNVGAFFEFDPTTLSTTKRFDCANSAAGQNPKGSLIYATNNKFYGMTELGGTNGFGVLFEYDLPTNSLIRKIDFDGLNGKTPTGSLLQASNGKLYGMTPFGGLSDFGVIYEYDPTTSAYTVLHNFSGTVNGACPKGTLIQASNGKFYGMTEGAPGPNSSTLFEYDLATSTFITKYVFASFTMGVAPSGALLEASNGKLYGMTSQGGLGADGVIFEYDIILDQYTKLFDFANSPELGSNPRGSIIEASNGKLYGMTERTQDFLGDGVIFEYDISTNTYLNIFDFDDGAGLGWSPRGSMVQASNGKLYGLTGYVTSAWRHGDVLFEYDINTDVYTVKLSMEALNIVTTSGAGGLMPYGDLIEVGAPPSTANVNSLAVTSQEIAVYPNPFNDIATIEIKHSNTNEVYNFELTDVLGRRIKTMENIQSKTFQVSRNGIQSGMYFYKIYTQNEVVGVGKLKVN